jgi:hypothetical protein
MIWKPGIQKDESGKQEERNEVLYLFPAFLFS